MSEIDDIQKLLESALRRLKRLRNPPPKPPGISEEAARPKRPWEAVLVEQGLNGQPDMIKACEEWAAYRRECSHLSNWNIRTWRTALKKWGSDFPAVTHQSIANGWAGLFPTDRGKPSRKKDDAIDREFGKLIRKFDGK